MFLVSSASAEVDVHTRSGGEVISAPEEGGVAVRLGQEALRDARGDSHAERLGSAAPGVAYQQTSRGSGALFLRGQIGPSIVTTLDGIRLNGGFFRTGPNQYLEVIDPLLLGEARLVLGAASVRHGSDAMGGVVQLEGPAPQYGGGLGAWMLHRWESADQGWTHALRLDASSSRISWTVAGSITRQDALRVGGGERWPGSDLQRLSGHSEIAWLPEPTLELRFSVWHGVVRDAGRTDRLWRDLMRRTDTSLSLARLHVHRVGTGMFSDVRLTVGGLQWTEVETVARCQQADVYGLDPRVLTTLEPFACAAMNADAVRSTGRTREAPRMGQLAGAVVSELPEELVLRWGGDALWTRMRSSAATLSPEAAPVAPRFPDGATWWSTGGWATIERGWDVGRVWTLTPVLGGRVHGFGARAEDVPEVGQVSYSRAGGVGMARLLASNGSTWMLESGWQQGFRAPNLQETTVLGDTGNFFEVPNASLRAERAESVDVAVQWDSGPLRLAWMGWALWTRDAIGRETLATPPEAAGDAVAVRRVNQGTSYAHGAGLLLDTAAWRGLSLSSRIDAWRAREEILEDDTRRRVDGRRTPPPRGSVSIHYAPQGPWWRSTLHLEGALSQTRLHPEDELDLRICEHPDYPGVTWQQLGGVCPGTEGWTRLSWRNTLQIASWVRASLDLENVLDAGHRVHGSGVDASGFSVRATLEGTWGR